MSLGNYLYVAWRGQGRNDVHLMWQAFPAEPPEGAWRSMMLAHPAPETIVADPYLGYSSNGLFFVAARGSDGAIWWNFQIPGVGGWTSWLSSGGNCQGQPSMVQTRTGGSQAFCRGAGGALETVFLPTPELSSFSPWTAINGDVKLAGDPHAIVNKDGAIQVFARDEAGRLLGAAQTGGPAPSAAFTRWTPLGGP
jgi:hypothetical protein